VKILLVSDYGTLTGGAEGSLDVLRTGLRARGHDARLLTSSARAAGQSSIADWECFGTTSRFRALVQTANPLAPARLRAVLGEFRPDVVHVKLFLTQLSPLILPALRNVPSIYHAVWYRSVCPTGTKLLPDGRRCVDPAGTVCLRNSCVPARDWGPLMVQMRLWRHWRGCFDAVVANSEATRAELERAGIAPVEVVYNGLPPRPQRPPLADPPTVAFAGRLVREKGVDVLLRAFTAVVERLPEAQLLVAGEGAELARLRRLAGELRIESRVRFLGKLAPDELDRRLAPAWVQAVPSVWAEPFGNVAVEALQRGTAVVASNAGGLAEIVRPGETGLLVPPRDVNALGAALLELLGDRERADALGQRGREDAAARFGVETCLDGLLGVYERVRGGP
jgi:glycosyltransferase involved in cell wall biosynthesis